MSVAATNDGVTQALVRELDEAVRLGDVQRVTERVKSALEAFSGGRVALPERYLRSTGECYARRLLHRDPELGYTAVVMTWGPGQGTELHDHAGIWCVECVLAGELLVTQYDLVEQREDRYRFEQKAAVRAGVGTAGCLIPPFEYHTLANALPDATTVTLHVYGGEMDFCNLYRREPSGYWRCVPKTLEYAT